MSPLALPLYPPFLTQATLQPLPTQTDVLLLDARFDSDHFHPALFDEWHIPQPESLKRAVVKRRAEYLVSRYCLQQAMHRFGIHEFVLSNDRDRAPLWPTGIAGSLSHTHQRICALLTRRDDLLPGIDCERIMAEEAAQEMAHLVAQPAEIAHLTAAGWPFATALTLIFSAKESLYKAVWPRRRQFMTFSAAQVIGWDSAEQQLTLRLAAGGSAGDETNSEYAANGSGDEKDGDYAATGSGEDKTNGDYVANVQVQPDTVLTWVIGLVK